MRGEVWRLYMLKPEIIEKIRREKEERNRQDRRIPLYVPEIRDPDKPQEQEEKTDRIIVIDL